MLELFVASNHVPLEKSKLLQERKKFYIKKKKFFHFFLEGKELVISIMYKTLCGFFEAKKFNLIFLFEYLSRP